MSHFLGYIDKIRESRRNPIHRVLNREKKYRLLVEFERIKKGIVFIVNLLYALLPFLFVMPLFR